MKKIEPNYKIPIFLLITVIPAIVAIWCLQDFLILLLALIAFVLICIGPDKILQNIRQQKAKEAEDQLPIQGDHLIGISWNIFVYLVENHYMEFHTESNSFYMDAVQNSEYRDQGATIIIRVHTNMGTRIQDEGVLTEVAQQYLAYQQQTPLGQQNSLLQRVLLESICIKNGFLEFTFHDKNFYVPPRDASNNLKDDYYG